jgi:hypothetical protein
MAFRSYFVYFVHPIGNSSHEIRSSDTLRRTCGYDEGSSFVKYMLLVHHDEVAFAKRPEDDRQSMLLESVQLANQLHANGQYLGAAPLHPTSETTCVRVRDGKRIVTDGPFAETREQVGGYFLVDAKDLSEALDIAARIPGARIGTVEIRPVTEVVGLPDQ